jgi:hypothetical protein
MVETKKHFIHRLNLLGRKHQAMSRGYTTQMRTDGLIFHLMEINHRLPAGQL